MRVLIHTLAIVLASCFALPDVSVGRGPGDGGHALPTGEPHGGKPVAGMERKVDKLEFAAQHPKAAAAAHNANQNSTAANISGLHTNLGGANAVGQGAGNASALLGNGSLTGANSPLHRHAFELISFLEMARNSTDPNVATRATQILQQFQQLQQVQQHFSQGQTPFNGSAPAGLTTGTTLTGGTTSTGQTNPPVISHTHSTGEHNSHAGANSHSSGHGSH
jgi:hypothetical protein